ncbi:MAG TPA: hypothetical protein VGO47_09625 [Chlamydiales bacterium]|jgi:hypothetical protein|nr:hypothetical protein [Chlamydiales bacterium]
MTTKKKESNMSVTIQSPSGANNPSPLSSNAHCSKNPANQSCTRVWEDALPKLVGWSCPADRKATFCIKWTREVKTNGFFGPWQKTTDETNECIGFLDNEEIRSLGCTSKTLYDKISLPVHLVFTTPTSFPELYGMRQTVAEFNSKVIPEYLGKCKHWNVISADVEKLLLSPDIFFKRIIPLLDRKIRWLERINLKEYSKIDFQRNTQGCSPNMVKQIAGPTEQGAKLHFMWDSSTTDARRKVAVMTYETSLSSKPDGYVSYAFKDKVTLENLPQIIAKIPGLKHISMQDSMGYMTQQHIAKLASNPGEIESLHFHYMIDDDYIATLAEHWPTQLLGQLKRLNLSNTLISNKCIPYLLQFLGLVDLNVVLTQITPDGVKLLQKTRPKLRVYSDYERQIHITAHFLPKKPLHVRSS